MPVDLEALKALCGPQWFAIPHPRFVGGNHRIGLSPDEPWANFGQIAYMAPDDAAFATAARTAVPELIAEVTALRALVAEAMDFEHAFGCPAVHGEGYRCVCGRREWLARAQWALGE